VIKERVTMLVGLAFVALVAWFLAHNLHGPQARVGLDAGAPAPAASEARTIDAAPPEPVPAQVAEPDLGVVGPGSLLPDGGRVPPLPQDAPRQVRFGVVLVSYSTAQAGPPGMPLVHRSRADAAALAARLLTTASTDFHAAVAQGDPGSADDVGKVDKHVLEPAPEYVLFTLAPGAVGGPIDTPRGFWIVKRLE
jgi:hypothetical protein